MIEICFVCTGNTCRSVMAERIARKLARNKKMTNVKFSSAGVCAKNENITTNAVLALKQLGYDGRNRKSVGLSKAKPNIIYIAVTNDHKKYLESKKCLSFEDLAGRVCDPFGQDLSVYLATAKQIENNIKVLLEKIESLRGAL